MIEDEVISFLEESLELMKDGETWEVVEGMNEAVFQVK